MNPPDGKVDPNGATFRFLTGGGVQPPAKPAASSGAFPADVIAAAQASQKAWKIPAAVTLAQWALESNWGKAMPSGSNNPFGIKAGEGQPFVEAHTREVIDGKDVTIVAKFRKFASINEAFDQHGRLLATASPYSHARTLVGDPDAFADALTGVYATDPNYGTVLKKIMKTYNLTQYD
jgi:flagellum-specific peptidoglycan hydrolase FlgJ